ncbi:MAG: GNAT family N-acetyltransferase [Candidatus Pacearchaeota archaeon]|nr:GNAT family N-acetyltransferase [Candidatus Pacearchaeota archaeon]
MENIQIQKAKLEDLEEIQKLNLMLFEKEKKEYNPNLNLEWTFGEGTNYFKNSIESNLRLCLIAKYKEKIIGYLVGFIFNKNNPCNIFQKQAELENMFVLEEYRSKKVGHKLVEEFLDWARSKNVENVRVTANTQNVKAINFYLREGFKDFSHTLEINLK